MIRKIIGILGIIMGALSFVMLTIGGPFSALDWVLGSFSVYLLLAGVFIYFKRGMLQAMTVPFLIYYGMGGFVALPREVEYLFGITASALMLTMILYVILSRLARLKIIRTVAGLLVGVVIFGALQYAIHTMAAERSDIILVREKESTLFLK